MLASRGGAVNRKRKRDLLGHDCDLDTCSAQVIVPPSQWTEISSERPIRASGDAAGPRGRFAVADATTTIGVLKDAVYRFADDRNWEPYHSPKNVAMALAVEAAELMEPFRWLDCGESRRFVLEPEHRQAVADELADVAILVMNMSLSTGIDISEAVTQKLVKNAVKYPAPSKS